MRRMADNSHLFRPDGGLKLPEVHESGFLSNTTMLLTWGEFPCFPEVPMRGWRINLDPAICNPQSGTDRKPDELIAGTVVIRIHN